MGHELVQGWIKEANGLGATVHRGKAPDEIIFLHDSQLVVCSLTLLQVVGDIHLTLSMDTVPHGAECHPNWQAHGKKKCFSNALGYTFVVLEVL